jgi:hypothetical protein
LAPRIKRRSPLALAASAEAMDTNIKPLTA